MNNEFEFRKLRVMIPSDVFNELYDKRLLRDIDAIVTQLLRNYLKEQFMTKNYEMKYEDEPKKNMKGGGK